MGSEKKCFHAKQIFVCNLLTFNPVAFTLSGLSVEAIVAMDRNVT